MKNASRILASLVAVSAVLPLSFACAASFSGTVTAGRSVAVYAPIGGQIDRINVNVGDHVSVGDDIAQLKVESVYAQEDGTVTGIFAEAGDDAETVSNKYGALMYIEGESVYSISASTENAYNTTETKFVHVGETVYLSCYSDSTHTGTGIITSIEGTDYNVDVTSGSFLVGETVTVYRGDSAETTSRIGRGTLNRKSPTAVTAQGSIVSIAVQDGDTVKKGDLLLTTLSGDFDGLYMSGTSITSDVSGTIAKINLEQGANVEKGSVAAIIYPDSEMRVEASVSEYDLDSVHVGDTVTVELLWNQDSGVSYEGTVSMISAIADEAQQDGEGESDTTYTVYIDFTPDENTRYGMSAVVSTMEDAEEIEEEVEEEAAE